MGIRALRDCGRIDAASLPDIFVDIPAEEYELLAPLSAKAFVVENQRTMIFMEAERYANATAQEWERYYFSKEQDGYFEGDHMDFDIIVPFSRTAEDGAWKKSKLEKVKQYILCQL